MMKPFFKRFFQILLIGFIAIQFFRPVKNKSKNISKNDITKKYLVPMNIQTILKTSCYDCHSNNTTYPWYAEIQPVAWWLNNHIIEGKKELNFSEFGSYSPKIQQKKLYEICGQLKWNQMPLHSYLWIHKNAKIDYGNKYGEIIAWAGKLMDTIAKISSTDKLYNMFPSDSLTKTQ